VIYNFRYEQNLQADIVERLEKEKAMSQGWGGGTVNLDLRRQPDTFVSDCFECYKPQGMKSTRVPTNLLRIRQFKDGDLIAVPHLPARGKVTILIVSGDYPECYEWKADEDHQNHRIRIKAVHGLGGNLSIYNVRLAGWYAKLQWLRLPVLAIPEHEDTFVSLMKELEGSPAVLFAKSSLDDYLAGILEESIRIILDRLRLINPSMGPISFEAVCEKLVCAEGYEVVDRNHYDKEGGDFDLRCIRNRSLASPFEGGEVNLFVQAKKHTGITDEYAVQQVMKMMDKDSTADGCVMSTCDDFSEAAKRLAERNGILLMDGRSISRLLLRQGFR